MDHFLLSFYPGQCSLGWLLNKSLRKVKNDVEGFIFLKLDSTFLVIVISRLFYRYINAHSLMMTFAVFLSSYCLHFLKPDREMGILKILVSLGMYAAHRQSDCLTNTTALDLYSFGSEHCKKKKEYLVGKDIVNRKVNRNRLEVSRLIWDFLSDYQEFPI